MQLSAVFNNYLASLNVNFCCCTWSLDARMQINNLEFYFQTCLDLLESAWTNMKSLKAKFRKTDVSKGGVCVYVCVYFPVFLGVLIVLVFHLCVFRWN